MRKLVVIAAGVAGSLAGGYGELTDPANATYVCRSSAKGYAGYPPIGVMQVVDEPGHRVQLCTRATLSQRAADLLGLLRG